MSTLVLVRHGPSSYVHGAGAINRAGVERWRRHYDDAGILGHAHAPPELVRIAAQADRIITSDLPRARESAARLASPHRIVASPLLREIPLAVPEWPTRLPLPAWGALMYLHWQLRRWRGLEPKPTERDQVRSAVRFILDQPGAATSVVVTHGVLRVLLVEQLRRDGWQMRARARGYGYWSAWILQRGTPAAATSPHQANAV